MLAGKRNIRVGDLILKEIALIIQDRVKDPRVQNVTMTGIRLTNDLKLAKVFYSVFGDEDSLENVQTGLASAKGFIKKELGQRLSLRYIPEITFFHDRSLASASHMEKLLEQLNTDEP
jgi:ribosome-binding factor A